MAETQLTTDARVDSLRKITLFDYGMHIASPIVSLMILTVIALIINYVKRDEARGTVYESHMNWMISTCWWTLLWLVVAGLVGLVTFGLLSWVLVLPVIWYLYRMIKGLLRALDGRTIE